MIIVAKERDTFVRFENVERVFIDREYNNITVILQGATKPCSLGKYRTRDEALAALAYALRMIYGKKEIIYMPDDEQVAIEIRNSRPDNECKTRGDGTKPIRHGGS